MSSDNFDFFEHLLLHGLEHIIEEILLLLPLEDVLCSVNLVCRWAKRFHNASRIKSIEKNNAMNF